MIGVRIGAVIGRRIGAAFGTGADQIAPEQGEDDDMANPNAAAEWYDDFVNLQNAEVYTYAVTGAGASHVIGADAGHPGILLQRTGTTTTGRASILTSAGPMRFAAGQGVWFVEMMMRVQTLSNGTDTYAWNGGLTDSNSGPATDGVGFNYDSTASPNWRGFTAQGATRTFTDTGIVVTANAWTKLRATISADGTSVDFAVDGVTTNPGITANVPSGTQLFGLGSNILKSAGTTDRFTEIDYLWSRLTFATAR